MRHPLLLGKGGCLPHEELVEALCRASTTTNPIRTRGTASLPHHQVGFFLFPLDLLERADRVCRLVLPPEALGVGAVAAPLSSDATAGSFPCELAEVVSLLLSASRGWTAAGSTPIAAGARFPEPAAAAWRKRGGRLGPRPRCWFLGAGAAFTSATETGSSGTGKPESTK